MRLRELFTGIAVGLLASLLLAQIQPLPRGGTARTSELLLLGAGESAEVLVDTGNATRDTIKDIKLRVEASGNIPSLRVILAGSLVGNHPENALYWVEYSVDGVENVLPLDSVVSRTLDEVAGFQAGDTVTVRLRVYRVLDNEPELLSENTITHTFSENRNLEVKVTVYPDRVQYRAQERLWMEDVGALLSMRLVAVEQLVFRDDFDNGEGWSCTGSTRFENGWLELGYYGGAWRNAYPLPISLETSLVLEPEIIWERSWGYCKRGYFYVSWCSKTDLQEAYVIAYSYEYVTRWWSSRREWFRLYVSDEYGDVYSRIWQEVPYGTFHGNNLVRIDLLVTGTFLSVLNENGYEATLVAPSLALTDFLARVGLCGSHVSFDYIELRHRRETSILVLPFDRDVTYTPSGWRVTKTFTVRVQDFPYVIRREDAARWLLGPYVVVTNNAPVEVELELDATVTYAPSKEPS